LPLGNLGHLAVTPPRAGKRTPPSPTAIASCSESRLYVASEPTADTPTPTHAHTIRGTE
jgi:hypothetical protein